MKQMNKSPDPRHLVPISRFIYFKHCCHRENASFIPWKGPYALVCELPEGQHTQHYRAMLLHIGLLVSEPGNLLLVPEGTVSLFCWIKLLVSISLFLALAKPGTDYGLECAGTLEQGCHLFGFFTSSGPSTYQLVSHQSYEKHGICIILSLIALISLFKGNYTI